MKNPPPQKPPQRLDTRYKYSVDTGPLGQTTLLLVLNRFEKGKNIVNEHW